MMQLQSFSLTALVMLTAPLGMVGVAVSLALSGLPMGFVAMLGTIALSGMIMRNSVILVDQIAQDRLAGKHLWDAIIDSSVRIPEGLVVGEDPEADARRFRRSEGGVCLITKTMIERLG